jgi:nucleoside-diphosphate-sugar epimerase
MNILVTGHHGYIGSALVRVLSSAGHRVTGLDTFFYRNCDLLPDGVTIPSLDLDVRDVTPESLGGYDAVVHLAALSNDPLGNLNSRWTYEINHGATLVLARAARRVGVRRFVFASSCSMYGASTSRELVTEDAPLAPLTPYAESKVLCEKELRDLATDSFSPIFMRNATAYGVTARLRADVVLNNLVGWAYTTGKVKILSDGSPWRPVVHVEDIARATLTLLEAKTELVHNEAFNIGANHENYKVSELAETVRDVVPRSTIEYARGAGPDPRSYRVDFGKLFETFPDFRLKWTARAGAEELHVAYDEIGLTREDFESHRYTRVKHLKLLLSRGLLDESLRWRSELERGDREASTQDSPPTEPAALADDGRAS